MSPIRVLLLSHAITPDRHGGLERYCRELGRALSQKGADVMIHARRVGPNAPEHCVDDDGVEIWRFSTPSKRNPLYALSYPVATIRAVHRVVRVARGTRVLHSHFPLQGIPLAMGRTPYIHTFHAPVYREIISERQDSYPLPGLAKAAAVNLMRRGEGRVVDRAQTVVVLSEFMRLQAIALGARPDSISLLPGGIDTERFSPGAAAKHVWFGEGPLLFTARRMVPRTGVRELIESFTLISREFSALRLAVAGSGPLEGDIRALIQALGLDNRVRLLGRISDAELVDWYRAADLVIMPTQELEGFGLTSAEALACGTPVVGTPAGANPEVLARLDASLVTRDVSPAAIAETVTALLREPDRLSALSARARSTVHPSLGWSSVADSYLALYERYQPRSGRGFTVGTAPVAARGLR